MLLITVFSSVGISTVFNVNLYNHQFHLSVERSATAKCKNMML